jgi:hypothetical protein
MPPENADSSSSWSELKSRENWNNLAIFALLGAMIFGWVFSKSTLSLSLPPGVFFAYALFSVGELVGCYRSAWITWRNSNSLGIWGKLWRAIRSLKPLLRVVTLLPFAAAIWCLWEALSPDGFLHGWPNIALAVGDVGWAAWALAWPLYISRSIILLPEDVTGHSERGQELIKLLRLAWQVAAIVSAFIAANFLLAWLDVSPRWRNGLVIGSYLCFTFLAGWSGRKSAVSSADKPAS